nr:hypothetical protein [Candidatus Delongbacteria bacterium]
MKKWDNELFIQEESQLLIMGPLAGTPDFLKEFEDEQGIIRQPVTRRRSYLMNHWSHINLARAKRTMHVKEPQMENPGHCFFCAGGESQTPRHAVTGGDYLRIPETGSWQLRCFNNLYPWMEDHLNIVETPRHKISLQELDLEEEKRVIRCAAKVIGEMEQRKLYPVFFRNQGYGASISHYHWQIGALPHIPSLVAEEIQRAEQFHRQFDLSLFDAIIESELDRQERVILDSPDVLVVTAFAPRTRFELLLIPKFQLDSLSQASPSQLDSLSFHLVETLKLLYAKAGTDTMNIIVHQLTGHPH